MLSHHLVKDIKWKSLNEPQRAVLVALVAVIVTLVGYSLYSKLAKVSKEESDRFTKQETNYFKSLKLNDCDEFIEEEKAFRDMGFRMLDDNALAKIKIQKERSEYEVSSSSDENLSSDNSEEEKQSPEMKNILKTIKKKSLNQRTDKTKIVGQPCYQVFTAIDYQMEFNNQNREDDVNCKLLLMLPMVPREHVENIKLNHLNLVPKNVSNYESKGSLEL